MHPGNERLCYCVAPSHTDSAQTEWSPLIQVIILQETKAKVQTYDSYVIHGQVCQSILIFILFSFLFPDIDDCAGGPCVMGTCEDFVNMYTCTCLAGFTGYDCESGEVYSLHQSQLIGTCPDSKVHGASMGPTWVLSAPGGPHMGPMNLAIRVEMGLLS